MTRLNLEQIRAFLAVVRMGGVRRAAHVLNLSQPAVTTRVRNLEDSLSLSLFDRASTGMQLTREGELFLSYAESFEHLAEMVEKTVMSREHVEGWLRVGASETIAQCWLPDFVARLHAVFPKVQVELNVDISSNLRDGLLAREIDLAFLLGPVSEYSVDNAALPDFALGWYATGKAEENPSDYLKRPVITYARNTRPYRELRAALLERVGPSVAMFPSSSLSACFGLVEAGLGVAPLPRVLGAPLVAAGRVREFDPGWHPEPLRFTASSLGEPKSSLIDVATRVAVEAAEAHAAINNLDHQS